MMMIVLLRPTSIDNVRSASSMHVSDECKHRAMRRHLNGYADESNGRNRLYLGRFCKGSQDHSSLCAHIRVWGGRLCHFLDQII
jgi:hypothetical protein